MTKLSHENFTVDEVIEAFNENSENAILDKIFRESRNCMHHVKELKRMSKFTHLNRVGKFSNLFFAKRHKLTKTKERYCFTSKT
jgi:hypothetical protein